VAGYWPRYNCDHLASSLLEPFVRPTYSEHFVSGENPGQLLARDLWSVHSNHAVNTSLEPCYHRIDVLSLVTQPWIYGFMDFFIDLGLKRPKMYVDPGLNVVELQENPIVLDISRNKR
jgi:hypothetical protein